MSQTQTFASAPEAAAAWWAQQLGAPTYKMVGSQEPREDQERALFAELVMLGEAAKNPMSSEQGDTFVAALAPKIAEVLGRANRMTLAVDYGPDRELAEAAEAAGIARSRFPWKTCMWIARDHVTASLGYHGATTLIWNAPDWVRPSCGQHKYTADWEPLDLVCSLPRYHEGGCGQYVADPERCEFCGGTFAQHYGKSNEDWTHSYSPAVSS